MTNRVKTPDQLIGEAVRRLREASGWTQSELGVELAFRGWRSSLQSAVASLERGKKHVGWDELLTLAELFAVSPQSLLTVSAPTDTRVKTAGRELTVQEWYEQMRVTDEDQALLWKAARRPSQIGASYRRTLKQVQRYSLRSREERLNQRSKFPGPTFVADRRLSVPLLVLGQKTVIRMPPGTPYVARDELEAEALLEEERKGRVRRIDRHTARRLRTKQEGTAGKSK
jgi:transcriptional regulator with XRE-family HTH domain